MLIVSVLVRDVYYYYIVLALSSVSKCSVGILIWILQNFRICHAAVWIP